MRQNIYIKALLLLMALEIVPGLGWGSFEEDQDTPPTPPRKNETVISIDPSMVDGYILKNHDFIPSRTVCGKFNQWLYLCCLESCHPWVRVSSWFIGLFGLGALATGASLTAGVASGVIDHSDPTVLWVAFGTSVFATGAKLLLMFNAELLRAMKEDAESNFQAMTQNKSYLIQQVGGLYDQFINEKEKRMREKEKTPQEIQKKLRIMRADKEKVIYGALSSMPGGKKFLKSAARQPASSEEMY